MAGCGFGTLGFQNLRLTDIGYRFLKKNQNKKIKNKIHIFIYITSNNQAKNQ
jgi:hypothetical protein